MSMQWKLEQTDGTGVLRLSGYLGERSIHRFQGGRLRLGIAEGWRGTTTTRVELAPDGSLSRGEVADPSFFNWLALPIALADTIGPDLPPDQEELQSLLRRQWPVITADTHPQDQLSGRSGNPPRPAIHRRPVHDLQSSAHLPRSLKRDPKPITRSRLPCTRQDPAGVRIS
ncbi:hypothetical protein [Kitasatospora sp. HPMI-4]|uniref:hypothetical protein n=1 Tax=Kitasatospora sp. HPMI-4 TaxID=3448443 RepID=UPI003F1D55D4